MPVSLDSRLHQGLTELNLSPSDAQIQKVATWLALLQKWNRTYNLTALHNDGDIIQNLVLDSLSLLPHLHGHTIVDVGSGSGVPGILLAIFAPQYQFTLLDSASKKTRFLEYCRIQLGLGNVVVVQTRAENFQPSKKFDVVISRALSSLADFLKLTQHLGHNKTQWLAIKGRIPKEELQKLQQLETKYNMTHTSKERHLPRATNKSVLVCMEHNND